MLKHVSHRLVGSIAMDADQLATRIHARLAGERTVAWHDEAGNVWLMPAVHTGCLDDEEIIGIYRQDSPLAQIRSDVQAKLAESARDDPPG
jgi:hypothetical protein